MPSIIPRRSDDHGLRGGSADLGSSATARRFRISPGIVVFLIFMALMLVRMFQLEFRQRGRSRCQVSNPESSDPASFTPQHAPAAEGCRPGEAVAASLFAAVEHLVALSARLPDAEGRWQPIEASV